MSILAINPLLRVLTSPTELNEAEVRRQALGVCPSPDPFKVWDNLLALEILTSLGRSTKVLDVGCRSGILLPWLTQLGFEGLWGVDKRLPTPPIRGAIAKGYPSTAAASLRHLFRNWRRLRRASGEALPFQDGHFAVVTCMSVIEHGVEASRFFQEAYRVLAPGGYLIISTDYWYESIATTSMLFGKSDVIFSPPQVEAMLRTASMIGFSTPPPPRPDHMGHPPIVDFRGLHYTFLFIVLPKPLAKG